MQILANASISLHTASPAATDTALTGHLYYKGVKPTMKPKKLLLLDGRTGEGGGQLIRVACALSAITSQPIRIENVRGNREGNRGGGLKAQHVSAVRWLTEASAARVDGLEVGSRSLEFRPSLPPTALQGRKFNVLAGNAASSSLLVFQAIFPFLLFAGSETGQPIELEIHGGTNVSFSLSYEYLDQVLLPSLQDRFSIIVERQLKKRAWSIGPSQTGCIWLRFQPLPPGVPLRAHGPWDRPAAAEDFRLKQIDVSMLVPYAIREPLEKALARELGRFFPGADINFPIIEDSGHDARMYALLVAHSHTGLRWGRDYLYDKAWKKKTPEALGSEISRKVCRYLLEEIEIGGTVDEYLQDQLVVFQALAEGRTNVPRITEPTDTNTGNQAADSLGDLDTSFSDLKLEDGMRKDKTHEPFGEGSMHTTTARWVASELLPTVQWFNKGTICDGAGISFP